MSRNDIEVMLSRIALLLGVLAVPVLLALASQALATSADPPALPESTAAVATVPAVLPSAAGDAPAPRVTAPSAKSATSASGPASGAPHAVEVQPRQIGDPADLDGDRDDDGIPDEEDDR